MSVEPQDRASDLSSIDFDQPPPDPVDACRTWFQDAVAHSGKPNPNAMTVATIDADGTPSARTVLLKGFDVRGAVFYTNAKSRKGRAPAANPRAALLFHWDALDRQIRIEGGVTSASDAESDAYFTSRHRESRIGAWASDQSSPVATRADLDAAVAAARARFGAAEVPRPAHWKGYRVSLDAIELWQGGPFRVHDRIVYRRQPDGGWSVQRLFP